MGITKKDCQLLFYSKRTMDVAFNKTLMLGRLQLYVTKAEIIEFVNQYKYDKSPGDIDFKDEYAEPLFKILGADEVDSLDYSNYEKATIIHDLNQPLPSIHRAAYTCVVDGGTIEHVFNFPVAIKNCMDALRVGGHYIGITPANNQMGHGFYQFSPELYYRVFSEENGFRVKKMIITPGNQLNEWYEVADPAQVKSRVMLMNNCPLTLIMVAEKISEQEPFTQTPYQSDYTTSWNKGQPLNEGERLGGIAVAKRIYQQVVPNRLRIIARNVYDLYKTEKVDTDDFGTLNPKHFKKIII